MTRGRRVLESLEDDIRDHIERETADNLDRGLAPEEARRQAILKFGNVALVKEDTRAIWDGSGWNSWRRTAGMRFVSSGGVLYMPCSQCSPLPSVSAVLLPYTAWRTACS